MEKDYTLLELDKFATYTEIKNAYRRKILQYHPDKSHMPSTSNKFIKFKQAYDNIMASLKRGKGKYKNIHHSIKITSDMANDINKVEFKRLRFKIVNGHYKEYIEQKTIMIPPNIPQIIYKEEGDQPVGYEIAGDLVLDILC